jgi:Ca2+-binding RTX toxin-like protein
VLTGGTGDDQMFGQAGNDRMIWNPGEGTDLMEGGDGNDTAEVNGGNGAEVFTITANGTRVRFDRVNPGPFSLDIGTTENLVLHAGGGDDMISASGNLAPLINLTLDGGAGNDTILGGNGNDTLIGGDGNDFVDGNQGSDVAQLGAGDDVFQWDPGDGSDTVDGQDGTDTLVFNGANINENVNITANHGHVTFTRDVAGVTMDLNSIEHIQFVARGGADNITVGDLTGTGVTQVAIDLAGVPGSGVGDGQADTVAVNATADGDTISITNSDVATVFVNGLAAEVTIDGADPSLDTLVVNGLGGNDTINASSLSADWIKLTIDGGAGNDTITGGQGNDTLLGGDGNDVITGGRGADTAFLGNGNDTFIWNPGDGSDVVEGQAGTDTLVFNGANIAESMDISANGSRVRLSRDVGNIVMDLNGVENIQVNALGAADSIVVNDLTGTDAKQVNIDLSATAGSGQGDGTADSVIVNGTAGNDTVTVASSGTGVVVNGLAAKVTLAGTEGALDQLTVNGGAGNDTINASALKAGQINLTINGGTGDDRIIGSQGDDLVVGGQGNDTALLGAGNDTFVWNPGDGSDVVEGQAGTDTLLFNGSNISENIDISANGSRARLSRDVGNVTMDLNGVEHVQLNALGGADTITVNDLTGTNVSAVDINLGAPAGGGDGQPDTIVLNGTTGDDVITITNNNGVVTVTGLATDVTISNFDANDRIVINGLGGDDVIQASGLTGMLLTANGGDGDDILIGSRGNDVLSGGAGDDVLIGNGGIDVLDGGPGNNVVLNSAVGAPNVALLGQFMASSFVTAGDGLGGSPITDAPPSQPPLLAQPHA